MASTGVETTPVGQGTRHQLKAPIHAMDVDEPGVALCTALVSDWFLQWSWHTDLLAADRCDECLTRVLTREADAPVDETSEWPPDPGEP
jgi:hypothetical protein